MRNISKVLHILNELRPSGAEVMLVESAARFQKAGIRSSVLSVGREIGSFAKNLVAARFEVYHIPHSYSPWYLARLYRFLRRIRPDVVHIHPERGFFSHTLICRIALPSALLIRTFHSVFFRSRFPLGLLRAVERKFAKRVFRVSCLAISDSVYKVERQYFGNSTVLVRNWIDQEAFPLVTRERRQEARDALGIPSDRFVLLTVGSCNYIKRHSEILETVAKVKDSIPNLLLLHRGDGPELQAELDLVKSLGIEHDVRFVPPELGERVSIHLLYWAADLFVLASRWEGLGIVLMEATCTGLPIVVYSGWGMNDFKPRDEHMFGFWADTPSEFEGGIRTFHSFDSARRDEYSRNARAFFDRTFSRERSLSCILRLYNRHWYQH